MGIREKAKTHKGRKMLEMRAPKIFENAKRLMIMKGRKGSETINELMKDLNLMRDKSTN